MGGTWFTSDTHFRHALVAELRGFDGTDAHDYEIVKRWNAVVHPEDTVWHLGDVALGGKDALWPWVDALNGTKHLVTGNHDRVFPGHRDSFRHQREWLGHFASVQAFARRRIAGHQVLLSHFPYEGGGDHTEEERYPQYRLPDQGLWLLHGHTHAKERTAPLGLARQVHVGLDAWDLRPVPLHEIERMILAQEAQKEALTTAGPGGEVAHAAQV